MEPRFTREILVWLQGFTRKQIDIILALGGKKPCESLYYLEAFPILIQWTEPYLNTLTWTIPYFITLNRTIPTLIHWTELYSIIIRYSWQPIKFEMSANQNRVLRHPRALGSGGGPFSALGSSWLAIAYLITYGPPPPPAVSSLHTSTTHIALPSSSVVQVGRVNIYIWKRLPVTGHVQFSWIRTNDILTPRFSRCILIVFCFQPLTELFYILDTRESAQWNCGMILRLQDFPSWQWFYICVHIKKWKN